MAQWIDIGPATALESGQWLTGEVDGCPLAVVRVGGNLYAFEDRCTHDGESLAGAELEGCEVICPRHGARFSLENGAALTAPAYEPLRIFASREWQGRIQVESGP